MSRPLRLHARDLTFHVMARGNARMVLFRDAVDHARFLDLLDETVQRWTLRCWAFCLMPNHYHLVLQTDGDHLSRAMQHLNGVYAQWWNRRHARVGHVTQGRFKAQVVQHHRYLVAVCRYVLLNPVRAGLIDDPSLWPWSSCAATLGLAEPPGCLATDLLLDACSPHGDVMRQRAALRRLLGGPDALAIGRAVREDARIIGDEAFAAQFLDEAAACASPAVPRRERTLGRPSLMRLLLDEAGGPVSARIRCALDQGHGAVQVGRALGLQPREVRRLARTASAVQKLPRFNRET